jgi:membrane-bound serine protease (ClpP class)
MDPLVWWGLGLLAVAVLLLVVDVLLPTFGVLAITSGVVAIAGVVCLWRADPTWGLIGLGLVLVGGPAFVVVSLNVMPYTPVGRRLVLGGMKDDDEAAAQRAGGETGVVGSNGRPDAFAALVGREGTVLTALHPVGTVRIDEGRWDALSEGRVVDAGASVRVVGVVDGTMLKVRAI